MDRKRVLVCQTWVGFSWGGGVCRMSEERRRVWTWLGGEAKVTWRHDSVCHDGTLFPQADGTNGLMEDCEVERVWAVLQLSHILFFKGSGCFGWFRKTASCLRSLQENLPHLVLSPSESVFVCVIALLCCCCQSTWTSTPGLRKNVLTTVDENQKSPGAHLDERTPNTPAH